MKAFVFLIVGLGLLALLADQAVGHVTPRVEQKIEDRVSHLLLNVDMAWVRVDMDGRDVILRGIAPNPELKHRAAVLVSRIDGVRLVDDRLGLAPEPAPDEAAATPSSPEQP